MNITEGTSVVALMSRDAEEARSLAKQQGVPTWYTDPQALIDDPQVNAVYIAAPTACHVTYAIMAMRAGKPVCMDAPLAGSYEDCARINHVAQEMHVPCYVMYYRRYLPYFQKVKELVNQQRIGRIKNVHVRLAAGEGDFYGQAAQQFDLLQEFFGVITHAEGYSASADSVAACFKFENGIIGSASWCFTAHESAREDRIEIIGDEGLICFSVFHQEPVRLHLSEGTQEFDIHHPDNLIAPIIRIVTETLQGRGDAQCTSLSATPTNWVLDKILGRF